MIFTPEQSARYARHFALPEIGVKGQQKLLQSKVLVIGAGALGSSALLYLAAAGVGTLGIADYDNVELSNLQRQIIHHTNRVGVNKAQSASQTVKELNPDINCQIYPEPITAANIQSVISNYDFIIDATDNFPSKFLINDACVLNAKPYSHAGAVRFAGQTMTYAPGRGPCLRCLLPEIPPEDGQNSCAQLGVIGALTGVLGSIQAAEAIKYLLNIGRLLTGRILRFDCLHTNFKIINMPNPDPACPICSHNSSITSLFDNPNQYQNNNCTNSINSR